MKIGASLSLLIATIVFDVRMPARCWIAPEMPHRDVELRAHVPPRLADLVAVRTPPVVGHGARRADGRVAERRGELLDELEVLRRP